MGNAVTSSICSATWPKRRSPIFRFPVCRAARRTGLQFQRFHLRLPLQRRGRAGRGDQRRHEQARYWRCLSMAWWRRDEGGYRSLRAIPRSVGQSEDASCRWLEATWRWSGQPINQALRDTACELERRWAQAHRRRAWLGPVIEQYLLLDRLQLGVQSDRRVCLYRFTDAETTPRNHLIVWGGKE